MAIKYKKVRPKIYINKKWIGWVVACLVIVIGAGFLIREVIEARRTSLDKAKIASVLHDPAEVARLLSLNNKETTVNLPALEEFSFPYPRSPIPSQEEFNAIASAAAGGDVKSQLFMGFFYANGDVVEQDYRVAADWYRKSAEQGNARAQYYLGFLYECGIGVERDYGEAFKWYMKSVEQNDPAAHLGIAGFHFAYRKSYMPYDFGDYDIWRLKALYLAGIGTSKPSFEENLWKNYLAGERYYQNEDSIIKAMLEMSKKGDGSAALYLAKMVFHSQGVSRDRNLGDLLVKSAATLGDTHAAFILGVTFNMNSLVSVPESPEEILKYLALAATDQKEKYFAYYYYRTSLANYKIYNWLNVKNKHFEFSKIKINEMAEHGYLYAQVSSNEWLENAANIGIHTAQAKLGIQMLFGLNRPMNRIEGKHWLDKAISNHDASILHYVYSEFSSAFALMPSEIDNLIDWFRQSYSKGEKHQRYT